MADSLVAELGLEIRAGNAAKDFCKVPTLSVGTLNSQSRRGWSGEVEDVSKMSVCPGWWQITHWDEVSSF